MMYVSDQKAVEAENVFRDHGGILRTSEALDLGIHPRTLYFLRNTGRPRQVSRGVYRLADRTPLEAPDLLTREKVPRRWVEDRWLTHL